MTPIISTLKLDISRIVQVEKYIFSFGFDGLVWFGMFGLLRSLTLIQLILWDLESHVSDFNGSVGTTKGKTEPLCDHFLAHPSVYQDSSSQERVEEVSSRN